MQLNFTPITLADRYRILPRSLGSGSFSVVQLAHDLVEKRQVACKIVRQKRHYAAVPSNEVNLLRSINHVRLFRRVSFSSLPLTVHVTDVAAQHCFHPALRSL